jgi:uncharacterized membrane protein
LRAPLKLHDKHSILERRLGLARKFLGYERAKIWIIILVLFIIAFNFIGFIIFKESHSARNIWEHLWGYGESVVFRVLTVSLILPILLLMLQTIFNIRGAIKERIEKEKMDRRERRLRCINLTAKSWNQLYDLTNEVRHFRSNSKNGDGIHELIKSIGSFVNQSEDVVRLWRFVLHVSEEVEEFSLIFINTMLHATQTVDYAIAEGDNEEECEELKDCLGVIQEGVKDVAHQKILSLLMRRADLLNLMEDRNTSDRLNEAKRDIEEKRRILTEWAEALKTEEITANAILSSAQGAEVEDFRQHAEQLLTYIRDNPQKPFSEFSDFAKFTDSFESIPDQEVFRTSNIQYSKQFVRHLARWFAREAVCQYLADTAKWQRRIGYAAIKQPQ